MGVIVLGLYAEGRTDERFLPIIIRRTSEMILAQHGRVDVETWEPIIIRKGFAVSDRSEYILRAAREAVGYDVLIVHSDADDRTHSQTKRLLFDPGYMRIQQDNGPLCKIWCQLYPFGWLKPGCLLILKRCKAF